MTGKLPPQNTEAEELVLGAIMLEREKLDDVVEVIPTKDHFYSEKHADIYDAILRLYRRSIPVDLMTVTDELKRMEKLDSVGGAYSLAKLTMNVVSSANAVAHAHIVKECFVKRQIITGCYGLLAKAFDAPHDALELVDDLGRISIELSENLTTKQYRHIAKPLEQLLADSIELSMQEIKFTGVPSGFRELDRISGGFKKSNLVIIAARPSVGKTAFALNIALNASMHESNQKPVGIFSLEMSERELLQRIVSNASGIDFGNITSGNLQQWELEKMAAANDKLKQLPIYIDDTFGLNMMQIRAKARKMKQRNGIEMIIIDYLQLIKGDGSKNMIREQEISRISRDLKGLAKELDIPVVALSQLSRAVEGRSDNIPKLSDLRESGAIEQDADEVYFLYQNSKEVLKREPFRFKERHLKRAKARNGSLADLVYDFNGNHQRFENEDLTVEEMHFTPIEPTTQFKTLPASGSAYSIGNNNDELPF